MISKLMVTYGARAHPLHPFAPRVNDPADYRPCDDCGTINHIDDLDGFASHEGAPNAEALLCQTCHDKREPSAWGRWQPGWTTPPPPRECP